MKKWISVLGGCAVGAANGLFGGGGGMVAVPLLEAEGRSAKEAHATALAVILPVSLLSAAVYLWFVRLSLSLFLPVCLGVTAGGTLGAKLLPVLPEGAVALLFSLFMLAAGMRMLF